MKLNFGHKIAIVYTIFAVSMVGILIMSMQYDHELVTENYYENELKYQGKKDAFDNLNNAPFKAEFVQSQDDIRLVFKDLPSDISPTGTLSLYKPDAARYDEHHEIALDGGAGMSIVPRGRGRYKAEARFKAGGTDYYLTTDIIY